MRTMIALLCPERIRPNGSCGGSAHRHHDQSFDAHDSNRQTTRGMGSDVPRRFVALATAILAALPAAIHAQLPVGVSVAVSNPAPTTQLVTDPVTGLTSTVTSRT